MGQVLSDTEISTLWQEYRLSERKDIRDQLIIFYSPLVKFVASRLAANYPANVDKNDLVSYGILGLIDAIQKFDPSMGNKFETYAVTRVRGAILDELRTSDWIPRSLRQKTRKLERVYATFEAEHQRAPTDPELAKAMELDLPALRKLLSKVSSLHIQPLDNSFKSDGDTFSFADLLHSKDGLPLDQLESREQKQLLAKFLMGLPERERLVITLYYFENLTLSEIGDILKVTESRVCQIHTKSLLALKSAFQMSMD